MTLRPFCAVISSHPSRPLQLRLLHRQSRLGPPHPQPSSQLTFRRPSPSRQPRLSKQLLPWKPPIPPPLQAFLPSQPSSSSPAAGTRLSASGRAPFIAFDYEAGDASAELFSIEPEANRLKTSNPNTYVCATFGENGQPTGKAYLVNCIQQNIDVGGDYIAYLNCDLNQGKLTCTAPWKSCNRDKFEWMCYLDEAGSIMTKFFVTPHSTWGYAVAMARDVPNGYSEVEWNASVVRCYICCL